MKVVSRGTPPELRQYTTSCGKCSSVLEFYKQEARTVHDRDGITHVLTCPVCRNEIWIASQALKPVVESGDFRDQPYYPK